jgi:GH15 family glucan-1,4-alpha-glucosidase
MPAPIEDYALIGDTHTAGLVSREGSIDWLCLPRFDSSACFAALLGDEGNGRWLLAPTGPVREVRRRYQGDTLVLETEHRTEDGVVRVVDCMPPRQRDPDVARVVEGVRGRVPMRMELTIRFDYGSIVPWVRHVGGALHAIAGPVIRSLLTLKALTYAPTGGIVAAPTTSLPEAVGGVRNWDYRYCWLRDSTVTLYALMLAGLADEARAWREWLLRAVAGQPKQMQILYGVAGERRITEHELPWLSGYRGSRPVRVGNAAVSQFQLDVYGEVMDTLHLGRRIGLESDEAAWDLQRALLEFLEGHWQEPDEGIWEIRGPRRQFTHSKVMAWVALDRGVKAVELAGLEGPVDRWRALRREIHDEVCREGFDPERDAFVQSYGGKQLDASLLLIPLVGFLPASDPRMKATVAAVQRELMVDGLLRRYPEEGSGEVDGLPPGEGTFLACSFWLADNLALMGRRDEAYAIFERLLELRNDVGLLAEQYDPSTGHQLGNFPQAFSHVALVNTARNLSELPAPAWARYRG